MPVELLLLSAGVQLRTGHEGVMALQQTQVVSWATPQTDHESVGSLGCQFIRFLSGRGRGFRELLPQEERNITSH